MREYLELNLIGRIQSLLINLGEKGVRARPNMLWLLLGLMEAGRRTGQLTEAEHEALQGMVGEMLAYSGGDQ